MEEDEVLGIYLLEPFVHHNYKSLPTSLISILTTHQS
jgi:hypothetical protein